MSEEYCGACGQKNLQGDNYCINCGVTIEIDTIVSDDTDDGYLAHVNRRIREVSGLRVVKVPENIDMDKIKEALETYNPNHIIALPYESTGITLTRADVPTWDINKQEWTTE